MALTYFTLPELRALPDVADTAKYPDVRLIAAGEWMEATIEAEVGTSFVARSVTETVDGDSQSCDGLLRLSRRFILGVTAVTSNGVAFDPGQLAEVRISGRRIFRRTVGEYSGFIAWDSGTHNIEVTYTAGYSAAPPADVKDAALQGARYRAMRTGTGAGASDRATAITNELTTIQLATAGTEHPTGLPEVDVVINRWRRRLGRRWVVV